MTSASDKLKRVEDHINGIRRDKKRVLQDIDSDIKEAEELGLRKFVVDSLKHKRAQRAKVFQRFLGNATKELKNLQIMAKKNENNRVNRFKDITAKEEARSKGIGRLRWIEEGGDHDEFEDAWPEIWGNYLKEQTLSEITDFGSNLSL